MFGFLLRFLGHKQSAHQEIQPYTKKSSLVQSSAKADAIKYAEQLSEDEALIIEFITQTRFADARYIAVLKLHSIDALMQTKTLMQKIDRRVYRFVQSRLNELEQTKAAMASAELILASAEALVNDATLTPTQVANFERDWSHFLIKNQSIVSDAIKIRYEDYQRQLNARLKNQRSLQQEIRNMVSYLDRLAQWEKEPEQIMPVLMDCSKRLENWKSSVEAKSLPKNTLEKIADNIQQLTIKTQNAMKESKALNLRLEWLEKNEQAELGVLNSSVIEQEWNELPFVCQDHYVVLLERYRALRKRIVAYEKQQKEQAILIEKQNALQQKSQNVSDEDIEQFKFHLIAMRQAIDTGSIQAARSHNDILRQMNLSSDVVGKKAFEKLNQMQSELRHLNDWAKWSERLSRENLIEAANTLEYKHLSIDDLANTVMHLREQWKELNAISGMATHEQWMVFDEACNKAYAPVLMHAKAKLDEKKKNIQYAEKKIAEIASFSSKFQQEFACMKKIGKDVNWKLVIHFYRQTLQSWRQLGIVGRDEKKRLDAEMLAALLPVKEKLYERTRLEIERREALIAKVKAMDATHRDAGKILRVIQMEWQASAEVFPLDNRENRKLWGRFKEACNTLLKETMNASL